MLSHNTTVSVLNEFTWMGKLHCADVFRLLYMWYILLKALLEKDNTWIMNTKTSLLG